MVDFRNESVRSAAHKYERIFYPRNIRDSNIEFTSAELPEKCHDYLVDLWKGLGDGQQVNWEQVLMEEPDLLSDQERQIMSMRQVKA